MKCTHRTFYRRRRSPAASPETSPPGCSLHRGSDSSSHADRRPTFRVVGSWLVGSYPDAASSETTARRRRHNNAEEEDFVKSGSSKGRRPVSEKEEGFADDR